MKTKSVNSSQTPLYREVGFNLKNVANTRKAFKDELEHPQEPDFYIYSRYRNPTVVAVEKQIAELEGSQWALLVETGMAAIDIAVSLYQKGGKTGSLIFFHEIYGGTNSFIDTVLIPRRGMDIHRLYAKDGMYDLVELEKMLIKLKPVFIFFEAVSNPMLIVADVEKIISLAKKHKVKIIVDNTFGTPYLWKPLEDGAELVIHSATKYLSGHGNITAGVICGNDKKLLQQAIEYRKWTGHFLSPDDAYRLGTQLKTFNMRFMRHCDNALKLAQYLESHPKIEKVLYPGLINHPTHAEAKKLFGEKGFGGMITFYLKGKDEKDKEKKCNQLIACLEDNIPLVPTLGDADTILLPIQPVWGAKYPEHGAIRLSVGIEEYGELEKRIQKALSML